MTTCRWGIVDVGGGRISTLELLKLAADDVECGDGGTCGRFSRRSDAYGEGSCGAKVDSGLGLAGAWSFTGACGFEWS